MAKRKLNKMQAQIKKAKEAIRDRQRKKSEADRKAREAKRQKHNRDNRERYRGAGDAEYDPHATKRGQPRIFTDPDIIEILAKEMALGAKKYELKALISKLCGKEPSVKKFEQVLSRCRVMLFKASNVSRDEAKTRSIAFYLDMAHDRTVDAKDRIKAMERVDSILGIDFRFTAGYDSPSEYAERVREFLKETGAMGGGSK